MRAQPAPGPLPRGAQNRYGCPLELLRGDSTMKLVGVFRARRIVTGTLHKKAERIRRRKPDQSSPPAR
jgi:hypothetical protein